MTDVRFLLLHRNSRSNLAVSKQMRKSKKNDFYWIEMLEII